MVEQECKTKQAGQGMLCLLDIKRKSTWDVSLAPRVTSKEGNLEAHMEICHIRGKAHTRKPIHSMGWLRSEPENRQDFFCLLSGWVCQLFPHQQEHLKHFYKVLYSHPVARTSFSGILKVPSLTQF